MKAMVNRMLGRLGYKIVRRHGVIADPWPLDLDDRHVRNCRVLANRDAILERMPQGGIVAEIGVGFGDFSARILAVTRPREFHAIDAFDWHPRPSAWGRSTTDVFRGGHEDFYRARFAEQIHAGTVRTRKGRSWELLGDYPDRSFDVIYVDAAHDYASVKRDADLGAAKLKPDGFLIFNDYLLYDHIAHEPYGVVQVVNELCVAHDYEMLYLALAPHMFCDVVLRKKVEPAGSNV